MDRLFGPPSAAVELPPLIGCSPGGCSSAIDVRHGSKAAEAEARASAVEEVGGPLRRLAVDSVEIGARHFVMGEDGADMGGALRQSELHFGPLFEIKPVVDRHTRKMLGPTRAFPKIALTKIIQAPDFA